MFSDIRIGKGSNSLSSNFGYFFPVSHKLLLNHKSDLRSAMLSSSSSIWEAWKGGGELTGGGRKEGIKRDSQGGEN